MIDAKPLVKRLYDLWYTLLLEDVDSVAAEYAGLPIVELGSGSSFIRDRRPEILTSDLTPGNVDMVINGMELPFAANSIRALVLTHTFHHLPDAGRFLQEAERVLVPSGVVSMVEITHTPFARFFFSALHPEPYRDKAVSWSFPAGHTMLDSNQALSWIVFFRDRSKMRDFVPALTFERWRYLPWLSYLLSGGVNLRSFVPVSLVAPVRALDTALRPLDALFALHWHLTLRKSR